MTMYDRIKKLRQEQEMSQEDLAKKVGYKGRSMIARVESGQVDISQSKVKAFAAALNTTIDYLMDGHEGTEVNRPSLAFEGLSRPFHPSVIELLSKSVEESKNASEKELLSLFFTMTDYDKEKLLDYARYIVDSYKRPDKRRTK
ncbi:MAG: helix-turn-helix domain-containing protein [Lachnospiraceae bacterium]|nr:helix-turn-helix domain-containing protein [Lachnospiraceae bacterium]